MILELENVKKNYSDTGESLEILKGINLHILQGQRVAIIGESGSGKSTLLHLIAGLDEPSEGMVKFGGRDLNQMSEADRSLLRGERMGIVYQQFHLLPHLTALENVMLPLQKFRRPGAFEKAQSLLREVGLDHRVQHYPHQLSGGECQRVALARALSLQPDLILADEPSGNLDSKTGSTVMEFLFELVQKHHLALILVTHSEELSRRCERVLRLVDGHLKEQSL